MRVLSFSNTYFLSFFFFFFFYNIHSNRSEVTVYCGFDCISMMTVEHFFMCLLRENVCLDILPIFFFIGLFKTKPIYDLEVLQVRSLGKLTGSSTLGFCRPRSKYWETRSFTWSSVRESMFKIMMVLSRTQFFVLVGSRCQSLCYLSAGTHFGLQRLFSMSFCLGSTSQSE